MAVDLFAPPTDEELKRAYTQASPDLFAPPTDEEIRAARGDNRSISQKLQDFHKLPPEEQKRQREELDKSADGIRSGARSMLDMVTLGASEPMFGAIHSVDKTFGQGIDAIGKKLHGEDSNFDLVKSLKDNYNEDVDQRRRDKMDHPVANFVGGVGGAFIPSGPAAELTKSVGGLIGKGANAVRGILPEINASSKLGRVAVEAGKGVGKIIENSVKGGAEALALEAPRQVIQGTTGYIKPGDPVPDIEDVGGVGALIGGGATAAGMGLRGTGRVAGWAGKKLMSAFLGPSEEHINYYLQNPEAVNGAKNISDLKSKVDGIVESLRSAVENGKKSVDEAKQDFRDVEAAINDHRSQSNFDYGVTSTQVRQHLRDARKALNDAFEQQKNNLKSVKAPTELADDVTAAVGDVKSKLIEGSKAAREHLGGDETIDTLSPYRILKDFSDSLNVAGKTPDPYTAATQKAIGDLITHIGNLPSKISEKEAKELLLRLDRAEQASKAYGAQEKGGFTEDLPLAYKKLREAINEQLTQANPAYNTAMEPVREAAKLHSEVEPLGDKAKAISVLNRVANPTGAVDREGLIKLGKATGRDFETPINEHIRAQQTLKNPEAMDTIYRGLPEHGQMLEAEKAARMLEGPEAKAEFAQKRLEQSGLLGKREAAEGLLANRQQGLLDAKGQLEPFKNITPSNSQQLLERAGTKLKGEERVELVKQLDHLSKLSDMDFNKEIQNLRTKRAFEGMDINGSRKVNLFAAVVGSVVGGIAGAFGHGMEGAFAGTGIGGTLGGLSDKYGPAVAKKVLDGVLKMKGSPTLAKIQALQVPPAVKAYLAKELADFNGSEQQ
jgi:hypothetical protein